MERYFYHGLEFYMGDIGGAADTMIKILNEGLITRNKARQHDDSNFDHVCLYKKNEEYDYEGENMVINSALGGWIYHGFVFVLNPDIDARKAIVGKETNLVDEWRCDHDIPPSDIVGIALPYQSIQEYLDSDLSVCDEESRADTNLFLQLFPQIMSIVQSRGLKVYDSDQAGFTDVADATLQESLGVAKK